VPVPSTMPVNIPDLSVDDTYRFVFERDSLAA
jgi:hypothetical protein